MVGSTGYVSGRWWSRHDRPSEDKVVSAANRTHMFTVLSKLLSFILCWRDKTIKFISK